MTEQDVHEAGGVTRREILKRGALLGAAVGAAGAIGVETAGAEGAAVRPRRGGTLRVGLIGGNPSRDNLDPHMEGSAQISQSYRQLVYSKLTDQRADGAYVNQLAESITPNKDATVWQIKLKRGITWHDGGELTVDDVIFTFQRILAESNNLTAARGNIDMVDPNGMRKINKYTMTVRLIRPWSDFPAAVGQRYINIIRAGATGPWTVENANGTGSFKVTAWKPGESASYVANRNYFESGKPYLNGISVVGIPDPVARMNALQAGQVDCVCDVPAAQVAALRRAGFNVIVNPGGGWTPIVMMTDKEPFRDVRVRQAMKHLIDRKKAIAAALQGFGTIGNDLFGRYDPLYAKSIPQRGFDPEKAKSLLRAAGHLNTQFTLRTSDAASDMVPLALVMEQGAKQAGVKLSVQKDPADTFWSNTWGVAPFTFSSWGYRPFFTQWLQSFVSFNKEETRWNNASQKRASRLVYRAAATGDKNRQRALVQEAQRLHWEDGGYIIPYFKQTLDAATKRVRGNDPHVFPFLSWYRFWNYWLA
jgi:peptide/nickel transport system substrate-binding protein